jgi:hypothetical protein
MNSTFFKLIPLAVMTLVLMIAMNVNAGAQTTPGSSMKMRGRIQTRSITIVDVTGDAVQRSDAGNEWQTLNSKSTQNVVSGLQQKIDRQRLTAQTAVIGANLNEATINDTIAPSGSVQLNEADGELVDMSLKIEKAQ